MSAKMDRAQGFKFFYGNAARDLAQYLPKEEATMELGRESVSRTTSTVDFSALNQLIDKAQEQLGQLEGSKRQLSFLLQDLKRIIG